jgi:hypothetical protein
MGKVAGELVDAGNAMGRLSVWSPTFLSAKLRGYIFLDAP